MPTVVSEGFEVEEKLASDFFWFPNHTNKQFHTSKCKALLVSATSVSLFRSRVMIEIEIPKSADV